MNHKYFLLIAGETYYPERGSENWIDAYETMEEAETQVTKINNHLYKIDGKDYNWYNIVDLRPWITDIVNEDKNIAG